MAVTPTHIPTEILRLLTAQEAAEYRLVPFAREAGGYAATARRDMTTQPLPRSWRCSTAGRSKSCRSPPMTCNGFLLQHYRPGHRRQAPPRAARPRSDRGGEFLFALVGEALRDNASDIHLEPYEQRCRIRMRIDGKLAERYVVERAQYMPLVNQIKILASLDISEKRLPQDGRIGYDRDGEVRRARLDAADDLRRERSCCDC